MPLILKIAIVAGLFIIGGVVYLASQYTDDLNGGPNIGMMAVAAACVAGGVAVAVRL